MIFNFFDVSTKAQLYRKKLSVRWRWRWGFNEHGRPVLAARFGGTEFQETVTIPYSFNFCVIWPVGWSVSGFLRSSDIFMSFIEFGRRHREWRREWHRSIDRCWLVLVFKPNLVFPKKTILMYFENRLIFLKKPSFFC